MKATSADQEVCQRWPEMGGYEKPIPNQRGNWYQLPQLKQLLLNRVKTGKKE